MVKIVQKLLPASRYSIKCPYAMTPKYVVIHNTANDAPAVNEISYMINRPEEISFHYAVDDQEIVQGIPENRNAWHSGDGHGPGNMTGIAIEICYSKSGGAKFDAAEKNAAQLAASLLKKYGWGTDHLKKHQDFDGKYCPHRTLDRAWNRFVKMVEQELSGGAAAQPEEKPKPDTGTEKLYRVRKSWADVKSQIGAFAVLENAKRCADEHPGYKVYDETGKTVYTPKAASSTVEQKKTVDELAEEVIAGKWGNGVDRADRITAAGYDYAAVQSKVNEIMARKAVGKKSNTEIAKEVIAGIWGNGTERRQRLTAAGNDFSTIQDLVNRML